MPAPAHFRFAKPALAALACLVVANCTVGPFARMVDPKYGVPASPRLVEEGQPVPKGGGYYRVGEPYVIGGRTYVPEDDPNYRAEGLASWYGSDFHGRMTANGEIFDKESISAAHPTLPIPSYARVTNLANRRSIIVRVNDRGPFKGDRVIDLSYRTAELLGFHKSGLARVRVEYVGKAALEGSDDRKLVATLRHDGRPAPAPSAVLVASAGGPFVPVAADPLPSGRAATIPSPPDRPFELGRYPATVATNDLRPSRVANAAPAEPRAGFIDAVQTARLPLVPVAGQASALVTGRGLY
ncbi:MAG: septal ring lytic transglycosylase RlpA family protein [Xanthobacteraceae bacterium]